MRGLCIGLLLATGLPCHAADDFKVIRLEQTILELERRVEDLSRQIVELQRRSVGPPARPEGPAECPAAPDCSPAWLSAANWNRVRAGMGEFEVIGLLWPPSSVRGTPDSDSRTLLYAMEIGASGFLSGRVTLRGRRVIEVELPVLK